MKAFTFNSAYGESYQVFVQRSQYRNGQTSLQLYDAEDGTPYATASVSMPDFDLAPDEIAVKDYSENEGMLKFLLDNNIAVLKDQTLVSGYVQLPIVKLLPETEWRAPEPPNKKFIINGMTIYAKDHYSALDVYELAQQAEQD